VGIVFDGFVVVIFCESGFAGAHGGVYDSGGGEGSGTVGGQEIEKIHEQVALFAQFFCAEKQFAGVNSLLASGFGISDRGGMIYETGAPAKENFGIIGILLGERFENRQCFHVLLLIEKSDGEFALGLIGVVGSGRRRGILRKSGSSEEKK